MCVVRQKKGAKNFSAFHVHIFSQTERSNLVDTFECTSHIIIINWIERNGTTLEFFRAVDLIRRYCWGIFLWCRHLFKFSSTSKNPKTDLFHRHDWRGISEPDATLGFFFSSNYFIFWYWWRMLMMWIGNSVIGWLHTASGIFSIHFIISVNFGFHIRDRPTFLQVICVLKIGSC